jgi:hypothetical protein
VATLRRCRGLSRRAPRSGLIAGLRRTPALCPGPVDMTLARGDGSKTVEGAAPGPFGGPLACRGEKASLRLKARVLLRGSTSTEKTNRDQTRFGWRRGVIHLHSPLQARSRQAGATVRRRRPFAADEPRHLQRHREHLAAARIQTPLGRQARRRCSNPQRYFSMDVP